MIGELRTVFERLGTGRRHPRRRVAGAGRNFCAGADLNWMRESVDFSHERTSTTPSRSRNVPRDQHLPSSCDRAHSRRGARRGHGAAAVCDLALASEDARFGFTEARLGIAPAVISQFVVPKIGRARPCPLRHRRAFRRRSRARHRAGTSRRACRSARRGGQRDTARDRAEWSGRGARRQVHGAQRQPRWMPWRRARWRQPTIAGLRVSSEGQEGIRAFLEKRRATWVSEDVGE